MSPKSAVLIATDEQTKVNVENDYLQYLCCQLMKLKFVVQDICNTGNNKDHLTSKIENHWKNSYIFLFTSQYKLVYEVLSKFFDEKLIVSKHLAFIYKLNLLNDEDIKKVSVPHESKIFLVQNYVNGINPVCIQYKNIFILPDDLNSLKVIYQNIVKSLLKDNSDYIFGKHYVLNCTQSDVSNMVHDKLMSFADSVNINRYCVAKSIDNCELHIDLSSTNFDMLVKCENEFQTIVSSNVIMNEINDSFWERLDLIRHQSNVAEALEIIRYCYTDYQPQDVFLCFNGGKDCTVLLYLTLYVLYTCYPEYKEPLPCIYIKYADPFDEVEEFVKECNSFFNLELITINKNIKEGLQDLLIQKPYFTACLMGTRRTDPHSIMLDHFSMTDPDWPAVMRVSPLLDWSYEQIWAFILTCKIPYCVLYDKGFSSLGSKSNTGPNPDLRYVEDGIVKYWPAYKLEDFTKERYGRVTKRFGLGHD